MSCFNTSDTEKERFEHKTSNSLVNSLDHYKCPSVNSGINSEVTTSGKINNQEIKVKLIYQKYDMKMPNYGV